MELSRARGMAIEMMSQHGLPGLGWVFKFDHARRRFGLCSYRRKTISLSRHLVVLNSEAEVRDTILHEIAHAIAGSAAGHGLQWKLAAVKVGARPERCYSLASVVTPPARYQAICPTCTTVFKRHKRTRRMSRELHCAACSRAHGMSERTQIVFEVAR